MLKVLNYDVLSNGPETTGLNKDEWKWGNRWYCCDISSSTVTIAVTDQCNGYFQPPLNGCYFLMDKNAQPYGLYTGVLEECLCAVFT